MALLGHSNCGKSALLNVLAAEKVSEGPAEVHARAGWTATSSIGSSRRTPRCLTRRTPALRPWRTRSAGGRAGARRYARLRLCGGREAQEQHHSDLLADYTSRSPHLRVAVMLIDSTRGPCAADRRVLRALGRSGVSVLPCSRRSTSSTRRLAASHAIVVEQLAATVAAAEGGRSAAFVDLSRPLPMISLFFAGIRSFWRGVARRLARVEERRANAGRSTSPTTARRRRRRRRRRSRRRTARPLPRGGVRALARAREGVRLEVVRLSRAV